MDMVSARSTSERDRMKREGVILFLLIGAGAALRFSYLSHFSFWYDEVATAIQSRQPTSEIIFSPLHPVYPPFYFLLLHVLPISGTGEWLLRFPSALAGTLTIPLMFLLGKQLFDTATGMMGALLLTISPFHIYFSQEARPYAIVMVVVTAALLFFTRWLQSRQSRDAWIATGLLVIGAYVQSVVALSIVALNIFMVFHARTFRPLRRSWLKTQAVLALCLMPYVLLSFREYLFFWASSHQLGIEKPLPLQDLMWMVGTILFNFAHGFTFSLRGFGAPLEATDVWSRLWVKIPFILIVLPLIIGGWKQLDKHGVCSRCLRFLIIVPFVLTFLISLRINWLMPNHLSVVFPPFCLLMAWGLCRLLHPWNWIAGGLVCLLSSISLAHYYFDPASPREPWRAVTQYVSNHSQDGDTVLFDAPHVQIPYNYYARRPLPGMSLSQSVPLTPKEETQLRKALEHRYKRVWLVLSHNLKTGDYYPQLLNTLYTQLDVQRYPKIGLYLFRVSQ